MYSEPRNKLRKIGRDMGIYESKYWKMDQVKFVERLSTFKKVKLKGQDLKKTAWFIMLFVCVAYCGYSVYLWYLGESVVEFDDGLSKVMHACFKFGTKYSRMDQVKFVEASL